jgi:ribonuclease-3 family protein
MASNDSLYMNTTALAFLGDAVYEVYVRNFLIGKGEARADRLHRSAVKYVRAEAQARSLKTIMDKLTEDEISLVKRASNKKNSTKPQNVAPVIYKWSTAFEALIGYLYISDDSERLEEVIFAAMESIKNCHEKKTD